MEIGEPLLESLNQELRDLEAKLESHPYAATFQDFKAENGKQIYTEDYLDNMPSDFSGLLGRFGALLDVVKLVEDLRVRKVFSNDLKDFLSEKNPRFEISFDE